MSISICTNSKYKIGERFVGPVSGSLVEIIDVEYHEEYGYISYTIKYLDDGDLLWFPEDMFIKQFKLEQ
jgi:hypothetical protein